METDAMLRIVDLARLAPSVHNTQPWAWQIDGTTLELWADRERALAVSDPLGRNLTISCGSALHHALVAAEALGFVPTVEHLPEGADSDFLARLTLAPGRTSEQATGRLALLGKRRTDRRRFTSWPVPDDHLRHLAEAGRPWGASVLAVTDPPLRLEIEELLEDARRRQLADPRISEETADWIDHSPVDGVPGFAVPQLEGVMGEHATRFGPAVAAEADERILRGTEGLLVISTADDGPLSWLRAGESLSALWLQATGSGLSLVPLSQLIEVERTRLGLELLLPPPDRVPQMLARVGWQEIGRDQLPPTPRRTLQDVLKVRPAESDRSDAESSAPS